MRYIAYTFWIIKEIFAAGLHATVAAFRPNSGLRPVVIYYPLRVHTDWEIFWFTTSITVTPAGVTVIEVVNQKISQSVCTRSG